jgi:hypothetical protein
MASTPATTGVAQPPPPQPFANRNYSFRVRSHSVVSTDEQTKNYYYCKQTKARPSSSSHSHTMPATLAKRSSSGPTVHRPTPHYDRLPSRARSLGDSRSLVDMEVEIPEYFDSPSKIQWNFFLNLDEQTRRNKQREREELKQKSSQIEQLLKKSSPDEVSQRNTNRSRKISLILHRIKNIIWRFDHDFLPFPLFFDFHVAPFHLLEVDPLSRLL